MRDTLGDVESKGGEAVGVEIHFLIVGYLPNGAGRISQSNV